MADKKIIAVVGATGAQGGGLVRAILDDPNGGFAARALTRKTSSDKAQALAHAGAEVVEADLDSIESLTKAFTGAYGVFALTNFWEHFSGEKELEQARNLAEAAKRAGVKHVVWSTLEDSRTFMSLDDPRMPTLHGKYKVAHFDAKGEGDAEFARRGVPTTYLLTSFYWDNFIHFGMGPTAGPDGVLGITIPMGDRPLPGIAAEDIGKCAYGIFKAGDQYIGKRVGIAGEHLTSAQMAAGFSKALGRTVRSNDVSWDMYRSFGFPGADDLGNMFQFNHDFNDAFAGVRSVAESRRLNPQLQSFEQWLARNAKQVPVG
jgi:uncharacterized protein YbjT (DUF2867 family)